MHFPPYHKRKSWQRFFVGVFVGGIISYFVLLYMYGVMYEKLLAENYELEESIIDLQKQNEVLLESQEDGNNVLTIKEIEVTISNQERMKMDSLLASQLKTLIKEEISHLIGVDIEIVASSKELLISAIENKAFKIDDVTHHFTITQLIITPKMEIIVEANLLN